MTAKKQTGWSRYSSGKRSIFGRNGFEEANANWLRKDDGKVEAYCILPSGRTSETFSTPEEAEAWGDKQLARHLDPPNPLRDLREAANGLREDIGCGCPCNEHHKERVGEEHDDECERCNMCRVLMALDELEKMR